MEQGHLKDAEDRVQLALARSDSYRQCGFWRAWWLNRKNGFRKYYQRCRKNQGWGFDCRAAITHIHVLQGDIVAGPEFLKSPAKHTSKGLIPCDLGDRELAFREFEQATSRKELGLIMAQSDPRFALLREDRRWVSMAGKLGLK